MSLRDYTEHSLLRQTRTLASSKRIPALSACVVLYSAEVAPEKPPRLTMWPYPVQYVGQWKLRNGVEVVVRPIRPEDEPLMVKFHEGLSDRTVYLRYFHMESLSSRVAHDRLIQKCFIDYDREMALVAVYQEPGTGEHNILAVGRLMKNPTKSEGEVAVLVSDAWQRQGLGTELVRRLIEVSRAEKLSRVTALILPENQSLRSLANRFGFSLELGEDPGLILASLKL